MDDINRVMRDRRDKLDALREAGVNPYANDFKPTTTCAEVLTAAESEEPPDMPDIPEDAPQVRIAGRVMFKNKMGKATFLRLRDGSVGVDPEGAQHLQIYARRERIGTEAYSQLKKFDIGDIVGVTGVVFKTRTGETTIMVDEARILTKSLRPLPEKFHGLSDVETRFRQRYVDLIVNPEARATFRIRSKVISHIRELLVRHDFIEVETPMMHPIPGGATARPFVTHHNALDMPLYLRVAPELYLKRLVVGGFERVFEINRNFRNEGLSPRHNPEFTMLEFYQAYATYEDLIDLTEEMISTLAGALNEEAGVEGFVRPFGEHQVDYKRPFARFGMAESLTAVAGLDPEVVADPERLSKAVRDAGGHVESGLPPGKVLVEAFEALVEDKLIQPTFITDYPIEDSPLSRKKESDPRYVDRFELFVCGNEIANAFSELNDPIDQKERFESQVAARESGDDEAMYMDLDYVRALEYGMPPAAGEGVGIDRLAMLMADKQTIREVIFFPHMRPE